MALEKDPARETVEDALRKHPEMHTLTMAKFLVARNPGLFKSVENARSRIRYLRGNMGERSRRQLSMNDFVRPPGDQRDGNDLWDTLPEAIEHLSDWGPRQVDGKRALVLSDTHIPFHSPDALKIALQFGHNRDCDTIILNGDILDCYAISRWENDPRIRDFEGELQSVLQFLCTVRNAWPDANIVYNLGNHEERYEAFMRRSAPELLGIGNFELEEVLQLEELNIETVPGKYYIQFGQLPILHGHEFGRSVFSPVNPARGFYLRAKSSMLGGHFHRSSSHSENCLNGESSTTVSTGALCDLHPEYAPLNAWNHGFAIIDIIDDEGAYMVENKKIIGKRVFNA